MANLVRNTKRLIIRPMEISDYEVWKEYFSTMDESRNIWDNHNRPSERLTKTTFLKILKSQKRMREGDKFYDLIVFKKASRQIIGSVAAMDVLRSVSQTAYLGYTIHNKFWGQGYGKEATKAMIDIAFRDLKLHRVEAGIEPKNRRSILLARSLGLRKEGLKKKVVYLRGQWNDLLIYSTTCEELGIKWKGEAKRRPG